MNDIAYILHYMTENECEMIAHANLWTDEHAYLVISSFLTVPLYSFLVSKK